MKELKGVDENTAISFSSKEERDFCINIFKAHQFSCDCSHFGPYIFVDKTNVFTHSELEDENVISATHFLALNSPEKVEERDIIGWSFKDDLTEEIKNAAYYFAGGTIGYTSQKAKCMFEQNSIIYTLMKQAGFLELWFDPVYSEKPVFKVGDYIRDAGFSDVMQIESVHTDSRRYQGTVGHCKTYCIDFSQAIAATPEEIEAARPKRKYMKQVWAIVWFNEELEFIGNGKKFDSQTEANDWLLQNAKDGLHYSVRPFEVVAYE